MSVLYSLILIINLTPNANFQSHIIQSNLSKDECIRQAYQLKKDRRFFIKDNGEVLEYFQNSDEVLGDHVYYCYLTQSKWFSSVKKLRNIKNEFIIPKFPKVQVK